MSPLLFPRRFTQPTLHHMMRSRSAHCRKHRSAWWRRGGFSRGDMFQVRRRRQRTVRILRRFRLAVMYVVQRPADANVHMVQRSRRQVAIWLQWREQRVGNVLIVLRPWHRQLPELQRVGHEQVLSLRQRHREVPALPGNRQRRRRAANDGGMACANAAGVSAAFGRGAAMAANLLARRARRCGHGRVGHVLEHDGGRGGAPCRRS